MQIKVDKCIVEKIRSGKVDLRKYAVEFFPYLRKNIETNLSTDTIKYINFKIIRAFLVSIASISINF